MAVITGASAGIGKQLAYRFAEGGFDLLLVARRETLLRELADEIDAKYGVAADVLAVDLLDFDAVDRVAAACAKRRVRVLINNAGILESGPFRNLTERRAAEMVRLDVQTVVALTQRFLPDMLVRGDGRIVNIASVAGFQPIPYLTLYAATKAFVLSFSEALAEELGGSGVTVTAVCPGLTATDMLADVGEFNTIVERLPSIMISAPEDVARETFEACMGGEVVRVPGVVYWALSGIFRYPRDFWRKIGGALGRRTYTVDDSDA